MNKQDFTDYAQQSQTDEPRIYIPERFVRRVEAHLLGNYAQIRNYPLIMCIVGEPGIGKTWQLRRCLDALGVVAGYPGTRRRSRMNSLAGRRST